MQKWGKMGKIISLYSNIPIIPPVHRLFQPHFKLISSSFQSPVHSSFQPHFKLMTTKKMSSVARTHFSFIRRSLMSDLSYTFLFYPLALYRINAVIADNYHLSVAQFFGSANVLVCLCLLDGLLIIRMDEIYHRQVVT